MGGIGKTALALEAAHRACAQEWFPGGTLFVDLRGYDDDPVTADQAVLALLDALGVQGPDLPTTAARQYDVYRDRLAGRPRTLLILDNASDPAQFRELLPGTDRHRVLITSRDRQDTLPIRHVDLETLDPADSVALLTRALHDADERDDRAAREPDALLRLASLCGHLPLALQIAAAMLRRRRHRGIASLVTEIEEAGDPTRVLDNGSPGRDLYGRSLVLRPVLETSYRRLAPEQARLLRLLALAPGEDSGTEALSALAGLDEDTVLRLLEDLTATHLVTVVNAKGAGATVRWRMHDLVRTFGASVVTADPDFREEGDAARERMLEFCLRTTEAASDRLSWLPGRDEPERFADRSQALAWLDGERSLLVAATLWAREERYATAAIRLALDLADYLDWRRYFDDKVTVSQAAVDAARRAGHGGAEAAAWNNLGVALVALGRGEEARDAFVRALGQHQSHAARHFEAQVWNNLGLTLRAAGRSDEAIDALTRALELFRTLGDRHYEAMTSNNLGTVLRSAGRLDEAIDAHTHSHEAAKALGDRLRAAMALSNLANALLVAGRGEKVIQMHTEALEIYEEYGDWFRTGQSLNNLAIAHQVAQHPVEARACWLMAVDAYLRANAPEQAARSQSCADALT